MKICTELGALLDGMNIPSAIGKWEETSNTTRPELYAVIQPERLNFTRYADNKPTHTAESADVYICKKSNGTKEIHDFATLLLSQKFKRIENISVSFQYESEYFIYQITAEKQYYIEK